MRKYGCSLGNGPYIAGKAEIAQILKEIFIKYIQGSEIFNILLGEGYLFHVVYQLLESRHNGKAAVIRLFAIEHIKINNSIAFTVCKITV